MNPVRVDRGVQHRIFTQGTGACVLYVTRGQHFLKPIKQKVWNSLSSLTNELACLCLKIALVKKCKAKIPKLNPNSCFVSKGHSLKKKKISQCWSCEG